ncbi:tagaturonate epimerase [Verrucomicrobium sp. GAS474]|uniref:tagaturonate epimerase family protein n=1 Tax=Verrucomicrobium sp. GAS474 TaxID=1882831 RepID=UPI00087ADA20|nr:tagaturonate epimerase family protein [Verrucomicrobium sp. GAS474]SDU12266.1 tagaturonate epimerase [Verrucomicrobium sp. GAS474]
MPTSQPLASVAPIKKIGRFSLGMGDRFGRQGKAQLQAVVNARNAGIEVEPVWNKSNREHTLIGTEPGSVRTEAREAVVALGWDGAFHVDADHINLGNVDRFIEASDFYTIDVADYTGKPASDDDIEAFVSENDRYLGALTIPGMAAPLAIDEALLRATAKKFLWAMQEAGRIYRHIAERKAEPFVTEVSVDETDSPQTPVELFLILAMIAGEGIPVQTIAPKFTGRFNKGVDYVGNLAQFEKEFDEDLHVVAFAIREFGLPATLKLSVHSGSDKFSIYPIINRLVHRHGAGLHVKTAGTTWLEEVIGLAESGGAGLGLAKTIYKQAFGYFDELVAPYATVLDIDKGALPSIDEVEGWTSEQYVAALRHDPACPGYNPHFRQFIHVSFKIAAKLGTTYLDALTENRAIIARNVTDNLFRRHLLPIFGK